jgi:hypothetical protein
VIWLIKHPDDNQTAKAARLEAPNPCCFSAEHLIAPVLRKAQYKQLVV